MSMDVIVVNHEEVPRLLPMGECMEAMVGALKAYSAGEALVPLRSIIWLPDKAGGLGLMPGYLGEPAALGVKIVTVFPKNEGTPFESHQGSVMLFDVENGRLLTIIDAGEITAIRTAAVSGVATRLLAREDAGNLALLGTGTQARTHLEAMLDARSIRRVRAWGKDRTRAERFVKLESKNFGIAIELVSTAQEAVEDADIICTVTGSKEPILCGDWIAPGTHINAVGACLPTTRELDADAVVKSKMFVDSRESTLNEAGDFLFPQQAGLIDESHILGELGEVLGGSVPGRRSEDDVTLFKSLGLAIEDLASAHVIYTKALRESIGTTVTVGGLRREAN